MRLQTADIECTILDATHLDKMMRISMTDPNLANSRMSPHFCSVDGLLLAASCSRGWFGEERVLIDNRIVGWLKDSVFDKKLEST